MKGDAHDTAYLCRFCKRRNCVSFRDGSSPIIALDQSITKASRLHRHRCMIEHGSPSSLSERIVNMTRASSIASRHAGTTMSRFSRISNGDDEDVVRVYNLPP